MARLWLRPERLRTGWRVLYAGVGFVAIALLATAAMLTPNPSGSGTHHQLGLPPCTFKVLYNIPCPSCGMTTSWSHLMHGSVGAAFWANAGGALLAVSALCGGPWLLISAVRGYTVGGRPAEEAVLGVGVVIVVVTLAHYAVRLLA
ncbi:MAG TPA: DUF2752 domain-containing protein [Pirellulales bacterium]